MGRGTSGRGCSPSQHRCDPRCNGSKPSTWAPIELEQSLRTLVIYTRPFAAGELCLSLPVILTELGSVTLHTAVSCIFFTFLSRAGSGTVCTEWDVIFTNVSNS